MESSNGTVRVPLHLMLINDTSGPEEQVNLLNLIYFRNHL
jgi:hypothetical protein